MAKNKKDEFDTETTFADMNVEGFSWYNPARKRKGNQPVSVTRKEYWAMVKGLFLAMLPALACIVLAFLVVFGLCYLWLGS